MIQRQVIYLLTISLLLTACQKNDSRTTGASPLSQLAIDFLKQKQSGLSTYKASKIDLLLKNLMVENVRMVKTGSVDLIICDLKTYRNTRNPQYSNTYYKTSFLLSGGKILHGYLYTIHTSLTQDAIDRDFSNILMHQSTKFTGEVVTNSLDDQFLFSSSVLEGKLINTKEVGKKPAGTKGTNGKSANEECTDYYLVTTTYYSDGHVEEDWEYLYTTCNSCDPAGQPSDMEMDCQSSDDGGSGSGDGPSEDANVTEEITTETEETDSGDDGSGASAGGQYAPVKYTHKARKYYRLSTGYVENVEIFNTLATPLVSGFIDSYGISGTRSLTLFGHFNRWSRLNPPLVMINWSCVVHGRYVSADERVWTRQWNHSYAGVR